MSNKRYCHRVVPNKTPKDDTPKKVLNKVLPIVAIDFDGTLCFNKYPYIENPNTRLLDWIRVNREHYTFILWTCRHGHQLKMALKWLKEEQGIEFDLVNENVPWKIAEYGDCRKVYADWYIDDKNLKWKEVIDKL